MPPPPAIQQHRSATGTTLTTSVTVPVPSARILRLLHDPSHLLSLNPDIASFLPSPSTADSWELTNRIPVVFGLFRVMAVAVARMTGTAAGVVAEVDARAAGVRTCTRSEWSVAEDEETGASTVVEVFDVLRAPWGLHWFVVSTAAESHKTLMARAAAVWETEPADGQ